MSHKVLFVGYLVQTPYIRLTDGSEMEIATLDRPIHPQFDNIRYEEVEGVTNVTKFLTHIPDKTSYPGYVINGYSIDVNAILPELGLDGETKYPSKYEYARKLLRPDDGLKSLGFDVIDEPAHPFSILHSGPYALKLVQKNIAPLNGHGLFGIFEDAENFCKFILQDNQELGTIWEVFG